MLPSVRFMKLAGGDTTLICTTALSQQPCLKFEDDGGKCRWLADIRGYATMLYELRYRLARSNTPLAVSARNLVRRLRRFSVPAPGIIVRPVLAGLIVLRSIYYVLWRVLVCEPLFKAYCTRYGRNLKTGVFLHWVQGTGEIVVGDDVWIDGKSSFAFASLMSTPPRLEIGDRSIIGHGCEIVVGQRVTIGSDCLIAEQTNIFDSPGHPNDPALRLAKAPPEPEAVRPIAIGNNVWIGKRVTICPGVTIGDNSIIATGAVVMTNVAPNSIVAGNPARKVGELAPIAAP